MKIALARISSVLKDRIFLLDEMIKEQVDKIFFTESEEKLKNIMENIDNPSMEQSQIFTKKLFFNNNKASLFGESLGDSTDEEIKAEAKNYLQEIFSEPIEPSFPKFDPEIWDKEWIEKCFSGQTEEKFEFDFNEKMLSEVIKESKKDKASDEFDISINFFKVIRNAAALKKNQKCQQILKNIAHFFQRCAELLSLTRPNFYDYSRKKYHHP